MGYNKRKEAIKMKVAICFAEGYEEIEALAVVDILRRGQVDITMVGLDSAVVVGAHNIAVQMDTTMDACNMDDIDMLILPGGGLGTKNLKACKKLNESLKAFKQQGKWLAAICAAPSVLGVLGLLENEKAVCYPGFEGELVGAEIVPERVVVSGHIITAIGAGAALEFGIKLLHTIKGAEVAEEVKSGMLI